MLSIGPFGSEQERKCASLANGHQTKDAATRINSPLSGLRKDAWVFPFLMAMTIAKQSVVPSLSSVIDPPKIGELDKALVVSTK